MSDQQIAHESQAPAWREGTSLPEAEIGTTKTAKPTRLRQTLRFLLHFGEMVLAMLVGMAIFAVVNSMILIPRGFVYLSASVYPQAYAMAMAVSMTVAMVAWMFIRKHPWHLSAEMAGAMLVPTVLLIAICWLAHLPSDVLLTENTSSCCQPCSPSRSIAGATTQVTKPMSASKAEGDLT